MTTEIVTYHYVRDQGDGDTPRVHGMTIADFGTHLGFAESSAGIVRLGHVVEALDAGRAVPPGFAFTFDDGLRDHADVAALLAARSLTGAFFVTVDAVLHRRLLDVHMIHYILGWGVSAAELTRRIVDYLAAEGIDSPVDHWPESGRFDVLEVRRLKGLLQRGLDEDARHALVGWLFRDVVGAEPKAVAKTLYLGLAELQDMVEAGMEIGGHGGSHSHMTDLSQSDLDAEMAASMELMDAVHGTRPSAPMFCYPHGTYDQRVVAAAARAGFRVAVTTRPGSVGDDTGLLELPRIDARELHDRVSGATDR